MTPKNIVLNIKENYEKYSHLTAFSFLQMVFDEKDMINLLKLRASFVNECEQIIQNLDEELDSSTALVCREFCSFFAQANLLKTVESFKDTINKSYISTILSVISMQELKEKYTKALSTQEFEELIEQMQENLHEEDEQIQEIIKTEFIEEVKHALLEHKVIGDKAYKKLNETLIAKFTLYKDKLKDMKSHKLKKIIKKLWETSTKYHDIYKKVLEMSNDTINLIGYFS